MIETNWTRFRENDAGHCHLVNTQTSSPRAGEKFLPLTYAKGAFFAVRYDHKA